MCETEAEEAGLEVIKKEWEEFQLDQQDRYDLLHVQPTGADERTVLHSTSIGTWVLLEPVVETDATFQDHPPPEKIIHLNLLNITDLV